eukprot:TRINITY_DN19237_c0_g1_i2.p1 TRINITY_DN19237_c0_g1~~TRINITY_DN19237_c0_g1_i2.p1  ORF type:complete len:188 (-),score=19.27 TRINITY_DN19237_c0_g1_i2:37-600(-)
MYVRELATGSRYYLKLESDASQVILKHSNGENAVCTQEGSCTGIEGLKEKTWCYVILRLDGTGISYYVSSVEQKVSLPIVYSAGSLFGLYLGLTAAAFKEIKLFAYPRAGLAKYLAHTQVDVDDEELEFYYPFDGRLSTHYFYNELDIEGSVNKPIAGARWIKSTEDLICPKAVSYTHLTLPTNREV